MWACRYNLFELLQKLLIVCYKDQFACYFEPALLQQRTTVSVSWYSVLDCTPMSLKKTADFGDLSRNMPYCQCTLPYGDCKAVMCVGCLPNSGELFAGTVNAHHRLSMTSINKWKESVDFILSLRNGRSSFTEQSIWCKATILQVGGGRLPGGNLNVQAGSPCKGPPQFFGGLSCEHPWALARDFTVYTFRKGMLLL